MIGWPAAKSPVFKNVFRKGFSRCDNFGYVFESERTWLRTNGLWSVLFRTVTFQNLNQNIRTFATKENKMLNAATNAEKPVTNIKTSFETDGFYLAPETVNRSLVGRGVAAMDAVIAGQYETGVPPLDLTKLATEEQLQHLKANPNSTRICKIDQAHLCNDTLRELVSDPAIGRLAAEATGAQWIQIWATQLLFKPSGDGGTASVGWHQDLHYWQTIWEGQVFTAWLALSDVTPESGPMRFVRGSHQWGLQSASDFFNVDLDSLKNALRSGNREWNEVAAVLPPGGVSLHHCLTVHGSGANQSSGPRRSIAIHLRTEKSKPIAEHHYTTDLTNPKKCPVIFGG